MVYNSCTRVVRLDAISESPGSSTSCPPSFSLILNHPDISVLWFSIG